MSDYHEGDTFYSRLLLIEAIGGDGGDGGSALSEWVHWAHHHHHHHHLFVSPWPAGMLMVITVVITPSLISLLPVFLFVLSSLSFFALLQLCHISEENEDHHQV